RVRVGPGHLRVGPQVGVGVPPDVAVGVGPQPRRAAGLVAALGRPALVVLVDEQVVRGGPLPRLSALCSLFSALYPCSPMLHVALKMLLGDRGKYLSLVLGLAFAVLLITQQGSIFLGLMLRATGPLQNISQAALWVTDPFVKCVSETPNLRDQDLNRVRSAPGAACAARFFHIRAVAEL